MPTTKDPVHLDLIDSIRVASPCSMRWEDMEGDGNVRHCGECRLDVYNFSEMTRDEVRAIVGTAEGRVCAGFYRRADGTVITRDCPVGLRAVRRKAAQAIGRVAAALGLLITGGAAVGKLTNGERLRTTQPFARVCEWLDPTPAVRITGPFVAGRIAIPRATPAGNAAGAGACDANAPSDEG